MVVKTWGSDDLTVQQRGHPALQVGDLLVDVGEDVRDIRQPVEVRPSPEPVKGAVTSAVSCALI